MVCSVCEVDSECEECHRDTRDRLEKAIESENLEVIREIIKEGIDCTNCEMLRDPRLGIN